MASVETIFMSIPAVHGQNSKSLEEVRVDDYLRAYTTTGRPPLPVPQVPVADHQRIALNLPPLFKPYTASSVSGDVPNPTPPHPPSAQRTVNPSELPPAQAFHATRVSGEVYQSISAQSGLTGFSHEELRYYAYVKGHKNPPTPVPMDPFVMSPRQPTTPTVPSISTPEGHDTIENLSAQPQFSSHSPEELRVAYMLAGRQLTSAEIFQQQGVVPPVPPATPAAPARPAIYGASPLVIGSPLGPQPTLRSFFL